MDALLDAGPRGKAFAVCMRASAGYQGFPVGFKVLPAGGDLGFGYRGSANYLVPLTEGGG
jgi:hypothetical protein